VTYLITFSTYGTHLHGDSRGSVDPNHNVPGTRLIEAMPNLRSYQEKSLRFAPYSITDREAQIILRGIRAECELKSWRLYAAHVRTNHVHVIVDTEITAERVMTALKAHATKLLRREGKIDDRIVWTRHGSTVTLRSIDAIRRASAYVLEWQGPPMACFQSAELDR